MDKKELEALQDIINIQGGNGNWNYSPYMQGLYNGLILAQSIMTNREPIFSDAPNEWMCERVDKNTEPIVSENINA